MRKCLVKRKNNIGSRSGAHKRLCAFCSASWLDFHWLCQVAPQCSSKTVSMRASTDIDTVHLQHTAIVSPLLHCHFAGRPACRKIQCNPRETRENSKNALNLSAGKKKLWKTLMCSDNGCCVHVVSSFAAHIHSWLANRALRGVQKARAVVASNLQHFVPIKMITSNQTIHRKKRESMQQHTTTAPLLTS